MLDPVFRVLRAHTLLNQALENLGAHLLRPRGVPAVRAQTWVEADAWSRFSSSKRSRNSCLHPPDPLGFDRERDVHLCPRATGNNFVNSTLTSK